MAVCVLIMDKTVDIQVKMLNDSAERRALTRIGHRFTACSLTLPLILTQRWQETCDTRNCGPWVHVFCIRGSLRDRSRVCEVSVKVLEGEFVYVGQLCVKSEGSHCIQTSNNRSIIYLRDTCAI